MKSYPAFTGACIECSARLFKNVFYYSLQNFGAPLCRYHQDWIRNIQTTEPTVTLYLALRQLGVPAELEKFDGHKTIDIAIPECRVYIEVDGLHHNFNATQALTDLQRTYYSFLRGFITLRIPNSLIECDLKDTVEYIVRFLNHNNQRTWQRKW
jgi:very-short-patch-repair endonuclease